MRLWLRLTLVMAALTLVPLVVTGSLAVRATTENETMRPEEAMSRDASTLATFVGSWVDGRGRSLAGWARVWDLADQPDDSLRQLLRATHKAMDEFVTVALVDVDGRPVVPPFYLPDYLSPDDREPGSAARADQLLDRLPNRLGASGMTFGRPYVPPGGGVPVVPLVTGTSDAEIRLAAEVSLAPLAEVFQARPDAAAVLVDGAGVPILGGDHPFLANADLARLLDLGEDLTFSTDVTEGTLQGAIWSVPYTAWKVVVLAPPTFGARAAARIRWVTVQMAGLALFIVLLVGLATERTITRSVLELRHHAAAVTKGELHERNWVDRSDEIGELGLALNQMATRLETTHHELTAFQRELQARVDARTRELEQAQSQLVRAGQLAAVAEIGAGLAHDLNNPLAALLGQVQILRAGMAPDPDEALARLEGHAQRCREVVDTMGRVASGELDAGIATLDLVETIDDAVEQVRPTFARRGVTLDLRPSLVPLPTTMAPDVARRVLVQLLEAMCAGLGEGATLQVEARSGARAEVALTPDRPVAMGEAADDWRTAGMRLWAARGLLDLAGGDVEEPEPGGATWRARFPEAT